MGRKEIQGFIDKELVKLTPWFDVSNREKK